MSALRRFRTNFATRVPRWKKAALAVGVLAAAYNYGGGDYVKSFFDSNKEQPTQQVSYERMKGQRMLDALAIGKFAAIHGHSNIKEVDGGKYLLATAGAGYNKKMTLTDKNDPSQQMFLSVSPDHKTVQAVLTPNVFEEGKNLDKMMKIAGDVATKDKMSFSVPSYYKQYGVKYVDISQLTGTPRQVIAMTSDRIQELNNSGISSFHVLSNSEEKKYHVGLSEDMVKKAQAESPSTARIHGVDPGDKLYHDMHHQYDTYRLIHSDLKLPEVN